MKKFVQIVNCKAHWIFEADKKPECAPYIEILDITGMQDVQEGWSYDRENGVFSVPIEAEQEPVVSQPTNAEIQENQLIIMEALADLFAAVSGV